MRSKLKFCGQCLILEQPVDNNSINIDWYRRTNILPAFFSMLPPTRQKIAFNYFFLRLKSYSTLLTIGFSDLKFSHMFSENNIEISRGKRQNVVFTECFHRTGSRKICSMARGKEVIPAIQPEDSPTELRTTELRMTELRTTKLITIQLIMT
jgi:hypothetical protein